MATKPEETTATKKTRPPGRAAPGHVWLRALDINLDHAWNSRQEPGSGVDPDARKLTDDELEASIRANGLLQAPEVRLLQTSHEGGEPYPAYFANFGFRRVRIIRDRINPEAWIHCRLQKTEGVEVADVDKEARIHNLVENVARENLRPWEVAEACYQLHQIHHMPGQQIAAAVGLSKSYVNNLLRVRKKIHPDVWAVLASGHADAVDWNRLAEIALLPREEQSKAWKRLCDERALPRSSRKAASEEGEGEEGGEGEGGGAGKKRGRPKKGEERKYDDRATTHELTEALKRIKASGKPAAYVKGATMALLYAMGKGELK